MNKNFQKEINLKVTKRLFPKINKIKNISHQCSLYEMNEKNNDWQFSQIQGPLFICSCLESSFKNLLILNQNSEKNYFVEIKNWLIEKDEKSFMIYYKEESNKVMCLSFFLEKEFIKVNKILNKVII